MRTDFHKPRARTRSRACICCKRPFRSTGNHHRMCDTCRRSEDDHWLYVAERPDRADRDGSEAV